jgi:hypothetical protein
LNGPCTAEIPEPWHLAAQVADRDAALVSADEPVFDKKADAESRLHRISVDRTRSAPDAEHMRRPRRRTRWITAAVVALAIPLVLWLLLMSWVDEAFGPRPEISDPRACGHTEVDLNQVTDHFYLNLPQASDLHFIAHIHPMFGEHWLQSTFTTTPSGLKAFLADSQLSTLGEPVDGHGPGVVPV